MSRGWRPGPLGFLPLTPDDEILAADVAAATAAHQAPRGPAARPAPPELPLLSADDLTALRAAPRAAYAFPWLRGAQTGEQAPQYLTLAWPAAEDRVTERMCPLSAQHLPALREMFAARQDQSHIWAVPLGPRHVRWARHFQLPLPTQVYDVHGMVTWRGKDASEHAAAGATLTQYMDLRAWFRETDQVRWLVADELRLLPILADMESRGLPLDLEVAQRRQATSRAQYERCYATLQQLQPNCEPDSPPQVLSALGRMGVSVFSVGKAVLGRLAQDHTQPPQVRQFSEAVLSARRHRYEGSMLNNQLQYAENGRVHPLIYPIGTRTGRIAMRYPPLQTLPPATRDVYRLPAGRVFLSVDFRAQELRILAALTQDAELLRSLHGDSDPHMHTAQRLKLPSRAAGKVLNYAIPYGVSALRLGQQCGVPTAEARSYLQRYAQAYPAVAAYIAQQQELATKSDTVQSLTGRRAVLDPEGGSVARQAVNYPIQLSAAEQMKRGLCALAGSLPDHDVHPLLSLHDELLLDMPDDPAVWKRVQPVIQEALRSALPLAGVDVTLDWGVGTSWATLEPPAARYGETGGIDGAGSPSSVY